MKNGRFRSVNNELNSFTSPKIVQFDNGDLNCSPNVAKRMKLELYKQRLQQNPNVHGLMLSADTGNMKYIGPNQEQPCRYYIGVLHCESGEMDLYRSEMYKLSPSVIGDNNRTLDETSAFSTETFVEKTDRLVEAFGSARQKRAVAARKKNLVDKKEMNTKITEVAGNVDLSESTHDSPSSSKDALIPPINTEASTPAQFYDLRNIISSSEENILLNYVGDFTSVNCDILKQWRAEKKYSEYILNQLSHLPISATARLEKAKKLLYLSYLMQLFKSTYADLRKKDFLSDIPTEIKNKLLQEFTLEKDRKRLIPKRLKDKTLCYILVLALIIDEFVLDCSLLMRDLKLGPARINMHLKAIGCVVETKKFKQTSKDQIQDITNHASSTIATLKVPLPKSFVQKNQNLGVSL